MITYVQKKLFDYISGYVQSHGGVSPSYSEMCEGVGLKSKSSIHRKVRALEERGWLRRLPNRARAIEIMKHEFVPPSAPVDPGVVVFPPRLVQHPIKLGSVAVPFLGKIGEKTYAHEVVVMPPQKVLHVPGEMFPPETESFFAIEMATLAMQNAGILPGDTLICARLGVTRGDIALVETDGRVLVRRWRQHRGSIALDAANPAYQTLVLHHDRVSIIGKMIGLLRKYPDRV